MSVLVLNEGDECNNEHPNGTLCLHVQLKCDERRDCEERNNEFLL